MTIPFFHRIADTAIHIERRIGFIHTLSIRLPEIGLLSMKGSDHQRYGDTPNDLLIAELLQLAIPNAVT